MVYNNEISCFFMSYGFYLNEIFLFLMMRVILLIIKFIKNYFNISFMSKNQNNNINCTPFTPIVISSLRLVGSVSNRWNLVGPLHYTSMLHELYA